MMEKMMALALSAVMALSLAACGGAGKPAEQEIVGMPNPFLECDSLEEAAENAGFTFDVPESVDGYAQRVIRTIVHEEGDAMIEVIYQNETAGNESMDSSDEIRMRKANGEEDISGDYTVYSETGSITIGDIQVTVKGEHGKLNLATWTDNGYTYSIGVYSESGVTTEEMSGFIAAVK